MNPSPENFSSEVELLVRRWGLPTARAPLAAALLAATREGATALRLDHPPADWGEAAWLMPPDQTLTSSRPDEPRPLALVPHAGALHLQTWRYLAAEQELARELLGRVGDAASAATIETLLSRLDQEPRALNPNQRRAVAAGLHHRLALITGGPGTGKTHTLARLLALLLAGDSGLEVRLSAPTGKAAERMREAVAAVRLPETFPAPVTDKIRQCAAGASTLHSLLGYNPGTGRCRHHARHPLSCDVLIVDEASMVDTLLWRALLAALPPGARLILLGDPNQLESVAAGDVLGALVRVARRPGSRLAPAWVELTENLRFRAHPAIGQLADAVASRDADRVAALLEIAEATPVSLAAEAPPAGGLHWLPAPAASPPDWAALPASVRRACLDVVRAELPDAALSALGRVRFLTAHRERRAGVAGINAMVETAVALELGRPVSALPRPVIVARNDPDTGLKNGSVGVIMSGPDGIRAAYFPTTSETGPHRVALSRLPEHETAWAMTIHRAQGSEFDQVVLLPPSANSPLATRELIYTGLTRARRCLHLAGEIADLRAALAHRDPRCTLLEAWL